MDMKTKPDAWGTLINQDTTGAIKVAFDFRE